MIGRIVKIVSNQFTVDVNGKNYDNRARGKFRNENITPMVGDFVEVDLENNYILSIKSRHTELLRPLIANVDQAIIVTAVKKPELSLNLLDKMLSIIIFNNVKPVVCFTKLDLLTKLEKKKIKTLVKYYKTMLQISVVLSTHYQLWKYKLFKNKLTVLAGQTGAGKSTLLNKLDKNLNLKTAPISESLGRGVHTTRHVELFNIASGLVADAPGFSSLDISIMTLEELKSTFKEFYYYKCPYKDCNHINETECAVKKAVESGKILKSRYNNYLKFAIEVKK